MSNIANNPQAVWALRQSCEHLIGKLALVLCPALDPPFLYGWPVRIEADLALTTKDAITAQERSVEFEEIESIWPCPRMDFALEGRLRNGDCPTAEELVALGLQPIQLPSGRKRPDPL